MHKRFMFGFTSATDLTTTLFKFKSATVTILGALFIWLGEVAGFIYQPKEVVYLLFVVMCFDWLTGALKAFKQKRFNSFTFQRMLLNIFLTMLLVGISTHLTQLLPLFGWLKINEVLLSGFMITYLYSIVENLHTVDNRMVSDKLFGYIQAILDIDTYFKKFFTPKNNEVNVQVENPGEDVAPRVAGDGVQDTASGEPGNTPG